jgi:diguanylate cyclase (GGDEF)-like protein
VTPEADAVRLACTDQVNRALARTTLGGIPASTLLVLILGSSVPLSRRIAFVAAVSCADVVMFVLAHRYLVRRRIGAPVPPTWMGACGVGMISVAWGSLAVIGLPDEHHLYLRCVYLLFVCGTSATYVVGAAARRLYYFSSQIPMLTLVAVGFIAANDHLTRTIAAGIPVYFIVMTVLHHDVHQLVIREIELRAENEHTTTQLTQANTRLRQQAQHDELTGLANRAVFTAQLKVATKRARERGETIGVLYVDLDRFKVVNDSLGHAAGDALISAVAHRIRSVTRDRDLVARLGGDELTILVEQLHGQQEVLAVAERVAASLERPFTIVGRPVHVTASIGVATNLYVADDAEALLSHADAAQYQAKQAGRNRIEVFDVRMREAIQRRLGDEEELRFALRTGQIVSWYQPEVDIASGRIVGAEALARWNHPDRGVLEAGTFIALADEAGQTYTLDDTVISAAVSARADLGAQHLGGDGLRIWCNAGVEQMTRSGAAARLEQLLARTGCDPRHLGIEVTETAILRDLQTVAAEAAHIRNLGIHVALDDFGTGHSSLTLLRTLPIDRVKIDRSFIRDITRQPRDAAIVAHVVALATDLGIDVVAEGVETPEQAGQLLELGCARAQGFLWSRAVPIDALQKRLAEQRDPRPAPIVSLATKRSVG